MLWCGTFVFSYALTLTISHSQNTSHSQPTRVTPQQLEEKREKGLCYNCDRKCTKGHKCVEKKLFYIEYEEEE